MGIKGIEGMFSKVSQGGNLAYTVSPLYPQVCICRFNQLQIKNIGGKCHAVADVYHIIRPVRVASVLKVYRVFVFLSMFLKQYNIPLFT